MNDNIFVYKKISPSEYISSQDFSAVSISESFKILLKRLKLIKAPF